MRSSLLWLWVVAGCLPAPVSAEQGALLWNERGERCSLRYAVENRPGRCSLRTVLQKTDGEDTWISERSDTYKYDRWAEIKLALPIRVRGSAAPQILVKLFRPNWLDYKLYTVGVDGVENAFSFSTRNEDAIRWVSSGGQLRALITFDRFEKPPKELEKSLPRGMRLQLVEKWEYHTRTARWQVSSRRWVRYKFGTDVGNAVLSKPSDCAFRYPTRE